jgi:predicted flap endonuclease-1-like 5' DNA nuclease
MAELLREYWIFLVIALLVGLLVAWWLLAAQRRTRVDLTHTDAEGGPARRNQALIDAPPAVPAQPAAQATPPPPTPEGLAGAGEAVAVSASVATPTPAPTPAAAAPSGAADDLTRIKGVGPKLVDLLASLGVTRFDEIGAWNDADIDRIDAQLGRFAGRIRRDSWPEQARLLAAHDTAGYEAKFGKL